MDSKVIDKIEELKCALKQNDVKKFEKYLTLFDKEYETEIAKREKITPSLIELYNNNIEKILKLDKIHILGNEVNNLILEEMEKIYTKEQMQILELLREYNNKLSNELLIQVFIFGYAMNNQFNYEANKNSNLNNTN